MKIVIAPDSYKGSLSAKEAGNTIREAFMLEMPGAEVVVIPMADGGEGTLDSLLFSTNGERVNTVATGPLGEQIHTCYGILGDGETAVIEMALVAGLPMVPEDMRNPTLTTTFGLGELINQAIDKGLRKFIVGLGGSATNDGGLGMLQALGAAFLDRNGINVKPIGESLQQIIAVDFTNLHPKLKECTFRIASDVENPLCGENGASYVFGPQKGATEEQIRVLDEGMSNYANLVEEHLKTKLQNIPGAGAAGGLGFGFLALGAEILSGSQVVAEAAGLENHIKEADWVITGEGQSDYQTLYGKAPFYVAGLAEKYGVGTILISGGLGKGHEQLLEHFVSCHSIVNAPMPLEKAIAHAQPLLFSCARNIARLINRASQSK
ncbi:glycerate kinase [Pontibacter diazotrophicus]|uniref:Glycerate kinase n=1 Tax=Pontibacter diazotrophicus TaxID=1400979 RepID=A0A3D8LEK6_9BACT|nr:glycerate kinase [Pontibacter diazotrophicus]RDV15736.1 glycerate kinase [Pontibacter diazotrophicus]